MKTVNVKMWGKCCKAFYQDGVCRVYDSVAGHYTTCATFTPSQVARIKRLANND